jgi:hypothetical protein
MSSRHRRPIAFAGDYKECDNDEADADQNHNDEAYEDVQGMPEQTDSDYDEADYDDEACKDVTGTPEQTHSDNQGKNKTPPSALKPPPAKKSRSSLSSKVQWLTPTTTATKKGSVVTPLVVDRSRGFTASRQRPDNPANRFLLTGQDPPKNNNPWNGPHVQWTEHVSQSMKDVFQQDMLIGSIKGTAVASADFAADIMKCTNWIKFGNGRTATSNGGNSFGNVFYYRADFPSLRPFFEVIDRFQVKKGRVTPPTAWIHGNNSVTSPNATNTHAKHRDREHAVETNTRETFGIETKRVRIAVAVTAPAGVHKGRIKETRYAYQGQDMLTFFATEEFSFTMMGRRANGKSAFFGSEPGKEDQDKDDITLLHKENVNIGRDEAEEDEDEHPNSVNMRHGVSQRRGTRGNVRSHSCRWPSSPVL